MSIDKCHDCHVLPGQIHEIGCDWEECPFCHQQLISCDCWYEKLGINPNGAADLTKEQEKKFVVLLEEKGRIPFGQETRFSSPS